MNGRNARNGRDEQNRSETDYCRNCAKDLTDPTNAGFLFEDDWYCSGMCAEVAAGFWSRGNDVADYTNQPLKREMGYGDAA